MQGLSHNACEQPANVPYRGIGVPALQLGNIRLRHTRQFRQTDLSHASAFARSDKRRRDFKLGNLRSVFPPILNVPPTTQCDYLEGPCPSLAFPLRAKMFSP